MVSTDKPVACDNCGAKAEVVYTFPTSSGCSTSTTTGSTLVGASVRCIGCGRQTASVRVWSSSPSGKAVDAAKAQVARYAVRLWNNHDLAGAVPDLVFWLRPNAVVLGAETSMAP